MYLQPNQLFDNRYRLIKRLGQGASAEVWLGVDTTAAGLKVAIKILNARQGMDTFGAQNFQKEFTSVFNIKHQNLLTPTNYALCDGLPYLVMPYLENGSVQNLLGRCDDNDVIKFLHDVSGGLAMLHSHHIVHQDIKPDNILLDGELNYIVTDFGISVSGDSSGTEQSGAGTQAYMSPERFRQGARATEMSDVWSMGATAYEMLAGDAPFGDNGGLVQSTGEKIPPLSSNVQPELRKIIMECLDPNPSKRPTAKEVYELTDRYLKTGSWKVKKSHLPYMIIVSVLSLLIIGAMFYIDYNRTKYVYYKDYIEVNGVPQGIGEISKKDASHRSESYMFEYKKNQVLSVSLVNGYGNLVDPSDSEDRKTRYAKIEIFYTQDGNVDYKLICDHNGTVQYKMDYDENLNTVTFRHNDKNGTEMYLPSNTTSRTKSDYLVDERSRISRYLLEFDDEGRLEKLMYAGADNVIVGDADNIYGMAYEYDDKGRVIKSTFLDIDGNPTANSTGLSSVEYEFDDDDNCITQAFYNIDHQPCDDGNGARIYRYTFDEYGNRTGQSHWLENDVPDVMKETSIHAVRYELDDHGNHVTVEYLDTDGEPTYNNSGIAVVKHEYDDNGFLSKEYYEDANGNRVEAYGVGAIIYVNDDKGNVLEESYFDQFDKPYELVAGHAKEERTYDEDGHLLSVSYFDKDNAPFATGGTVARKEYVWDDKNQLKETTFLDTEGNPVNGTNGYYKESIEYDSKGSILSIAYFDKNGKPTVITDKYAKVVYKYDDKGNEIETRYLDDKGKLTRCDNGYARVVTEYDPKTNLVTAYNNYDTNGEILYIVKLEYDKMGNLTKRTVLDKNGKLNKNRPIVNYKYDNNKQIVEQWYTDLNGNAVNAEDEKYSRVKFEYDKRGNNTVTTYWSTTGSAASTSDGTHKWVREYNNKNQKVHDLCYGTNGQPIDGNEGYIEARFEYDKLGNIIETRLYDGYGKPVNGNNKWHRSVKEYDNRRNFTKHEYFDVNGKPVEAGDDEYAKAEAQYDSRGNQTCVTVYDKDLKVTRKEEFKYNSKGKLIEWDILDGSGKRSDGDRYFSKVTIEYDEDEITPKVKKYYDASDKVIANATYNTKEDEWNDLEVTDYFRNKFGYTPAPVQSYDPGYSTGGAAWQTNVRALADACPMDLGDGSEISSISYGSSYVNVTIKLGNRNIYNMDTEEKNELISTARELRQSFRDILDLPSSVTLKIILNDHAGRNITSV